MAWRKSPPDLIATFEAVLPDDPRVEPMPGRTMREYVVVTPALVQDRAKLKRWVARSLSYAASLPVKEKKKAKAKPARVGAKR